MQKHFFGSWYLNFRVYLLFVLGFIIHACSDNSNTADNNKLMPIAFENIEIEGPMQTRALKNYDRLEDEVYYPENVFPLQHEKSSVGWPGDKEGRIMLGLTLQAQATHRSPKYLSELLEIYPDKLNEKGFLGPIYSDSINEQQLSGHGWLLRALSEYYFWKQDPKVKDYIELIINNLALPTLGEHKTYPIDPELRIQNVGEAAGTVQNTVNHWILSSDIGCDFIFMDGLIQAYQIVPSEELKQLLEEMIDRFFEMDMVEIKAQTHASLTGLRGVLRYYGITGDQSLLPEVEKRYGLYSELAMTENYENFNWFGRPEWTEPCAIVDSYILAVQLWQYTQNSSYLEDAQHIYFNAIAHTNHANGGFGLDYCVGPESNNLHVRTDEAYWCCTMRGGEGLARAIQYNYFTVGDTVFIPFYNSNKAKLQLKNGSVTISEVTDYPFRDEVEFRILDSELSGNFIMKYFIPGWTENHQLTVNGKSYPYHIVNNFIVADIPSEKGNIINLSFDIKYGIQQIQNLSFTNNKLIKLHYGPLLLGCDKGDDEVIFDSLPELEKIQNNIWKVKNTDVILTPIYHLLDSDVWKETGYEKQILFSYKH